uniref:Uncharacterized protein n=1 Tax=Anguilla anguilla TaxID=7936 RepID=A0A0E9Q6P7_ANGAN
MQAASAFHVLRLIRFLEHLL